MTITLNGVTESFDRSPMTIRELLKAKGWSFPLIIVKVDGALIERSAWDTIPVAEGSVVDATHLMSGG
jgi:sulfur carrier protein